MMKLFLYLRELHVKDVVVDVYGKIKLLLVVLVLKLHVATILALPFSMRVPRVGVVVLVKF